MNSIDKKQNINMISEKKHSSGNRALQECRENVADAIDEYVKIFGYGTEKHYSEIRAYLKSKNIDLYVMYQESDMCYNKTNRANLKTYSTDVILFEACRKNGYFRILGSNYPYTGDVIWKKKSAPSEVVGRWENGVLEFWGDNLV